jgi:DNA-binding MarR family transcriptional regulator
MGIDAVASNQSTAVGSAGSPNEIQVRAAFQGRPLTTGRPELLRDGDDSRFRSLVHDLLAFGAKLRDIRDGLAELIGLGGPGYTILISVARLEASEEVSVSAISRHLNVSQPFVTAEVHKLVDAGLLDKAPSVTDRRSVSLSVTDSGHRLLAELAPDQRLINDLLFSSLDAADFDHLSTTVSQLVVDAEKALELTSSLLTARESARVTA